MEFLFEFIWLEDLFFYLIKSTLVLTFGIFLSYICRNQSASLRHFILSVSIIGLLIFPLVSNLHTGWKTGLLPSFTNESKDASKSDVSLVNHHALSLHSIDNAQEESQSHSRNYAIQPAPTQLSNTRLWILLKYSLLMIWLSGMVFIIARQIFGLYGAYKLSKESENLKSSFWRHLLLRFLEAVSFKKKVHLLQHKKVKVPLTWGWLKPVVIMPVDSKFWTAEQRESALYHELSHVKRGDFLVLMLARISLGLYWFNPLSWLALQLMKKEQEKACDELVLKTGIKPSAYAANLLSIRRSMQSSWNPPAAVLGVLGRSQLNDRLLAILKQKLKLKEVKMRTKIFFSVLVILTITFLGMARPSSSNKDIEISPDGDVFLAENSSVSVEIQEEQKDQKKTEKKEEKEKKKDVFIWHMDEGKEGEVEVIITNKGNVKSFTLKEPVIIIKKDDSGKEIAITSEGKVIDIKKGEEGTWVVKGDAVTLHENMEAINLGEGSVITLKARTKDGHKIIEIDAPAVVVKKIDDSSKHITVKVSDEEGKKKTVVVAPRIHMEHRPDVHLQIRKTELKKIHEKLQKIHERLSQKMESKTEDEEQALEEMEETLKKLEKKLEAMESELKDINLSIQEKPHIVKLKHGNAISIKHKTDTDETEKHFVYMSKDKGHLMSFVSEEGEATFLAHMKIDKSQKQDFMHAIEELKQDLPDGYEIESEFDDETGSATIKIKGSAKSEDIKDDVLGLLKEFKEKLETKN
jgi:beta-lactamase regulating signal transducer with metallopeptidase domain